MLTHTNNKYIYISFAGQHAFPGGFSSCSISAAVAAQYFINLDEKTFFKQFNFNMIEASKIASGRVLSKLSETGNKLNLEYAYQATGQVKGFFSRISPKEISSVIDQVRYMKNLEPLKDLMIMGSDNCQNPFKTFFPDIFNRYKSSLDKNAFAFLNCAALHCTLFFIKVNPKDNKCIYCIYDSSPYTVLGGPKNEGIFEMHTSPETAFKRLQLRWKSDKDATIHALTTHTRVKALYEEVTVKIKTQSM